jgi:hypothetical protein
MPSCPHCTAGKTTVEIAGLRFHTLSDRWISCSPVEQQQRIIVPVRGEFIGRLQDAYQAIYENGFIRMRRRFETPHNP